MVQSRLLFPSVEGKIHPLHSEHRRQVYSKRSSDSRSGERNILVRKHLKMTKCSLLSIPTTHRDSSQAFEILVQVGFLFSLVLLISYFKITFSAPGICPIFLFLIILASLQIPNAHIYPPKRSADNSPVDDQTKPPFPSDGLQKETDDYRLLRFTMIDIYYSPGPQYSS